MKIDNQYSFFEDSCDFVLACETTPLLLFLVVMCGALMAMHAWLPPTSTRQEERITTAYAFTLSRRSFSFFLSIDKTSCLNI